MGGIQIEKLQSSILRESVHFVWMKIHGWSRFIGTLSFLKFSIPFWYDDLLMTRQYHRTRYLQIISHIEGAPNITLRIRRILSTMCLPLWKESIRSLLEHLVWMRINSVEAIIVIIIVICLRLKWQQCLFAFHTSLLPGAPNKEAVFSIVLLYSLLLFWWLSVLVLYNVWIQAIVQQSLIRILILKLRRFSSFEQENVMADPFVMLLFHTDLLPSLWLLLLYYEVFCGIEILSV